MPSVAATTYPSLEIILADNASEDGTVPWIEREYPNVKVIRHPENWLFSRGNNEAILQAKGQYVVLLNNDVEVTQGWLEPLVEVMEKSPDVGAVQPKLLQYHNRTHFEYAGAAGGFIDLYGYPFTRGRLFDVMEKDTGQYDDRRDVFWASGAAMMLRRDALRLTGLLDERFEMHMEEIDLCWRLHRHGYRVQVNPDSVAYHLGGSSLQKGAAKKSYYNFRNSLLMLYKNLAPEQWRTVFPRRALLDSAAAIKSLASGDTATARSITAAYRDAHRMQTYYRDGRPGSGIPLPRHVYRGSVALAHFVGRKNHFSELDPSRFS